MARASEAASPSGVTGAVGVALTLGCVAMIAEGMLIALRGEAFSDRAVMLVLITGVGGGLAGYAAALLALAGMARWSLWVRAPLAASLATALFIPATMFVFAVHNRLIEGRIEEDLRAGFDAQGLFWTLFGGMGLFTPRGLGYLAPGPCAVLFLTALILFWRWPRRPV